MNVLLGVNIDHVATVRQARRGEEPSVLAAARVCEQCGVSCVTMHLREDRRHIQDADIYAVRESISTPLNLEMALSEEIIAIARSVTPYMVTIVPEHRAEITTEGGLDVAHCISRLRDLTAEFRERGILVSLFVEPDERMTELAAEAGADAVEYHTGTYSTARGEALAIERKRLYSSAEFATSMGLIVNAGHGLNYDNVSAILGMKGLRELNIGHSIVSRAIFTGLERAVLDMKHILERG
jgi:pyridoxine 5-phosphate synthase